MREFLKDTPILLNTGLSNLITVRMKFLRGTGFAGNNPDSLIKNLGLRVGVILRHLNRRKFFYFFTYTDEFCHLPI